MERNRVTTAYKSEIYCSDGIRKYVNRQTKCVENQDDYVLKERYV